MQRLMLRWCRRDALQRDCWPVYAGSRNVIVATLRRVPACKSKSAQRGARCDGSDLFNASGQAIASFQKTIAVLPFGNTVAVNLVGTAPVRRPPA